MANDDNRDPGKQGWIEWLSEHIVARGSDPYHVVSGPRWQLIQFDALVWSLVPLGIALCVAVVLTWGDGYRRDSPGVPVPPAQYQHIGQIWQDKHVHADIYRDTETGINYVYGDGNSLTKWQPLDDQKPSEE